MVDRVVFALFVESRGAQDRVASASSSMTRELTRPAIVLRHVGVDEKWLGRRHKLEHKYVTIVSNLETGEPVWIGKGRSEKTLRGWLLSLTGEQCSARARISL
jgi:transposase